MSKSCYTQPIDPDTIAPLHVTPVKRPTWRKMFRRPGTWHNYPEQSPAGLWTTATDYALFTSAIMNSINGTGNPLLSTTVAKAMLTNVGEGDTYGLGLGLEIQNNEVVSFFHTGGNMGYRCAFQAFLNNESCIVVIPNAETGEDLMMEALRGAEMLSEN